VESERDVMRDPSPADLIEAPCVQHEQERGGAPTVEDDREQDALVLASIGLGRGNEDRLSRVRARLKPALPLAALDIDLDQLVDEVGSVAVAVGRDSVQVSVGAAVAP
jgi:hypothetical protein